MLFEQKVVKGHEICLYSLYLTTGNTHPQENWLKPNGENVLFFLNGKLQSRLKGNIKSITSAESLTTGRDHSVCAMRYCDGGLWASLQSTSMLLLALPFFLKKWAIQCFSHPCINPIPSQNCGTEWKESQYRLIKEVKTRLFLTKPDKSISWSLASRDNCISESIKAHQGQLADFTGELAVVGH